MGVEPEGGAVVQAVEGVLVPGAGVALVVLLVTGGIPGCSGGTGWAREGVTRGLVTIAAWAISAKEGGAPSTRLLLPEIVGCVELTGILVVGPESVPIFLGGCQRLRFVMWAKCEREVAVKRQNNQ